MAEMPAQVLTQVNHHPNTHVLGVRFEKLGKLYHFDYSEFPDIQHQDYVVVDTARGVHIGQVIGFSPREEEQRDFKPVLRIASGRDLLLQEHWKSKQVETIINVRDAASQVGGFGDVKWVDAEYNYNGTHLTILYSTEDDITTTHLRKELQNDYAMEIEFRRIGPREVARRLGGQGACGGPRCCSTFLSDFSPISIKMAKAQGIPLNPSEITGMCGRLRCCLLYEYEQYVEARKQLPKRNKMIGTPLGETKVADVHPLKDGVSVYIEGQRHFIPREDIIPLDEFRALQSKAAAGCSKNEGGGCDCGSHRSKSGSADLKDALEMAHSQTAPNVAFDEDEFDDEDAGFFEGETIAVEDVESTPDDGAGYTSTPPSRERRSERDRGPRQRNKGKKGTSAKSSSSKASDVTPKAASEQPKGPSNNKKRRRPNNRRGRFQGKPGTDSTTQE